ncbi:hypothetical protein F511_37285 [Dorcoceras hygrometricum]|uniref:Uncharacterized protein n=1 Tax=Dorcoceras hygrometricum TaxID=472368 RepID=A0A2Z7CA22_9LAMI|nr:hypothetical protein F511_37285 [Dorcoceras hygrometricum]
MKESRFWSWTGLAISTAVYREEPGSCNSGWSQAKVPASEFTREDPINALNEMVHEYKKLSKTFEEIKVENNGLKNSSAEPRTAQLGESDSLQTELSKLKIENDSLRIKSCELSYENEILNEMMSSWTKSSVSLSKLHETQKLLNDKSGLGFSFGEEAQRKRVLSQIWLSTSSRK